MKFLENLRKHKFFVSGATVAAATPVVTALAVLAEEPAAAPAMPTLAITPDQLTPLVEGVMANVSAILPYGIGLFAIFLGIRIIPSLFSRFVHM